MTEQRHAALGIHMETPDDADLLKRRQLARRGKQIAIVVLVLLALGAGRTIFSRMANARALEAGTEERAKQYVKTALPKAGGAGQALALPGTLQGFVQAPISARSSGYLKRWTKDIGSRVERASCWPRSKRRRSTSN